MATDIVVPTLGESVSEATIAQWLKKPGDSVALDEPLVELETDKVTLEVNASVAGVLAEVLAGEGDNVEVGALLGRIGEGDGAAAAPAAAPADAPAPAAAPAAAPASGGEATEILVPVLGESVSEATIAQWLKKPGEAVSADEPLVELETDKVTLEVNAPAAGTLGDIKAEAGVTVEVGALLAIFLAGATGGAPAPSAEAPAPAPTPAAPAEPAAAPDAPAAQGLDPAAARRSDGKITKTDLLAFMEEAALGGAGPAVRKLIEEKGLDPATIPASGRDGRLTKEDVLDVIEGKTQPLAPKAVPKAPPPASAAAPAAPAAAASAAEAPAAAREERVRMPKLRQTIAKRLKEAQNTAALLTTFNEADMGPVMALRGQYKDAFEKKHGVKLGFSSFFTKAVVKALQELPAVNARIEGDEIVYNKFYDIGMAVSTPNGLMVPVVRDCDKKSFAEIEGTLAALALRRAATASSPWRR